MRAPDDELSALDEVGLRRVLTPLESGQGPRVRLDGRTLLNFSSNDYLGLAASDALKSALRDAAGRYGAGSGASRLLCGSLPPHRDLEDRLAAFKNTEAAVSFSSGYAAALGALTALAGKDDILIIDKLCHASIIDGARLSGASIRVFPHRSMSRLESLLQWSSRTRRPEARVIVVTESVFSMDGDRAPLREICALAERFDALVMIDEAHAAGIIGPRGAGLAAELGVSDRISIHMGTLSKALGVSGGFIAGSRPVIDLIVNRARSLIYSTAPPPAVCAAAAAAVDLVQSREGDRLRAQLAANIDRFAETRRPQGSPTLESAIVPLIIGDETAALAASADLRRRGILIPAVRFPTVSRGSARLRITLSAAHTADDIAALAEAIVLTGIKPARPRS